MRFVGSPPNPHAATRNTGSSRQPAGPAAATDARLALVLGIQRTAGNRAARKLLRQWIDTDRNPHYVRWDTAIDGLRWYHHKAEDLMYFIAESANEVNARILKFEGSPRPRQFWLDLGLQPMAETEASPQRAPEPPNRALTAASSTSSVSSTESRPVVGGLDIRKDAWEPFVIQSAAHHPAKNDPNRFEETTRSIKGTEFRERAGAASPAGAKPGEAKNNLSRPKSPGDEYVFHLTTLRNLLTAPGKNDPRTGICAMGLLCAMGGGAGGASYTSPTEKLRTASIAGSKRRIAVTVDMPTIKMYHSHRLADTKKRFSEAIAGDYDLVELEPVVLRFRLTAELAKAMVPDPVHIQQQDIVMLIQDQDVPPTQIEALTAEGWQPVQALLTGLMETMPRAGSLSGPVASSSGQSQ